MTAPVISTITNTGTITLPTDTDTLVGKATTDILTNKTLTAPQINDTSSNHQYIFGVSELSDDRTVTLPLLTGNDVFVFNDHIQTLSNKTLTAPKFVGGGYIADSTGAELIKFSQTASAVNEITITNASTGTDPSITATGDDTHIDLSLSGKNNGSVRVNSLKIGTTAVTATAAELNTYVLNVALDNISVPSSSCFVVAPKAGTVTKITSIIDGSITVNDATISANVHGTNITDTLIIATGSDAATIDTMTPSDNNTINANEYIKLTTDGLSTGEVKAVFTIEITY